MSWLARRLLMGAAPPYKGVLDTLGAVAAGAWSMRRLRGGYAGPCLTVRRSSDNATANIGFTAKGDLNVSALVAFTGSGDGFVSTWYDQSGNAAPLTQANAAAQPQIVKGGTCLTLPTSAGRAALSTSGGTAGASPTNGQDMASATPAISLTFSQPFTRSSVVSLPVAPSGASPNPVLLNSNNSSVELYDTGPGQLSMYASGGFTAISGMTAGISGAALELFNQAASVGTFNSAKQSGSVGTGGPGSNFLGIGGYGWTSGQRNFNAVYGEVIVFPQALTAGDQAALMSDQSRYWETWSPYSSVVLADGPYAYWPLAEMSGTVAADVSGNGRNGTYSGTVALASSQLVPATGQAYATPDGSTGYVDVTSAMNFCAGSDWTIELWVNVKAWGAKSTALLCSSAAAGMSFRVASSGFNYTQQNSSGGGAAWSGSTLVPGTPTHVVLSVTGANHTGVLYVNNLPNSSPSAFAPSIASPFGIGLPYSFGSNYLNGIVGEVAVYNYALSAQQVRNHWLAGTQPPPDRLADWGPNSIGITKNLNSTSVFAPDPWNNANGALYFSGGANNGLNIAGSSALLLSTCTFEAWAKTATGTAENTWACYYNTASDVFRARQNNGGDGHYGFDTQAGGAKYVQLIASADGAWHHLCFAIYQVGSTWYLQCWADGQSLSLQALTNYTTIDLGSSGHLARIGSGTNGLSDNPFKGYLSNLRISNTNRYGAGATATSITVPTAPFLPDTATALLIPF